jgi:holo-[acyl-carrier protein] synthase
MYILGLGVDLVDIRRIEATLRRFGERFCGRVFTDAERSYCGKRRKPAAAFAVRYAAKEACAKALGTGFREGVYWRDIEVETHLSGKPVLLLHGGAHRRLHRLTPVRMTPCIEVSMTDEYPYGQATVVIAAVPLAEEREWHTNE